MAAPHRDPAPEDLRRRGEERIGARDVGEWPSAAGRALVAGVTRLVTPLSRLIGWGLDNLALVVTVVVGGVVVLAWMRRHPIAEPGPVREPEPADDPAVDVERSGGESSA